MADHWSEGSDVGKLFNQLKHDMYWRETVERQGPEYALGLIFSRLASTYRDLWKEYRDNGDKTTDLLSHFDATLALLAVLVDQWDGLDGFWEKRFTLLREEIMNGT